MRVQHSAPLCHVRVLALMSYLHVCHFFASVRLGFAPRLASSAAASLLVSPMGRDMYKGMRCVAYLRTSSLENAGEDTASYHRQLSRIKVCVKNMGMKLTKDDIYYDKGVSGTISVTARPKFHEMVDHMLEHDINVCVVDEASRLARDLLVQECAVELFRQHDMNIISAQSPDSFEEGSITAKLVRQIVGAVSEFFRSETMERLKLARDKRMKETKSLTLKGKPKVVGKKSRLERATDALKIKKALGKWAKKKNLARGDLAAAQRALTTAKVKTKKGKKVSLSQTATWLQALRKTSS